MNRAARRQSAKRGITAKDLRQGRHVRHTPCGRRLLRGSRDRLAGQAGVWREKLHMTLKGRLRGLFDSINKDYVSIGDLKRTLRDEAGVEIS